MSSTRSLHDPDTYRELRARLVALRPDAKRQWGRMTADQMLWHLAQNLETALGHAECAMVRVPVPRRFMRFVALTFPWPKGTPTAPEFTARATYDFEGERQRCLAALDEMAARPLEGTWPDHPAFGAMQGTHWKKLEAIHVDHHLRQFGA